MSNIISLLITIAAVVFAINCEVYADSEESKTVHLTLLKDTVVSGNRIYLSDVAECRGEPNLCREASGIDVSLSPSPGRSLNVPQSLLIKVLSKEWPGVNVVFEVGETNSRVVGAQAEVRSEEIKQKLQAWINDRIDDNSAIRLTVSKIVVPFGSGIRPSQTTVEFPDLVSVPFSNVDWLTRNMIGVRMTQFLFVNPKDADDQQVAQGQAHFIVERLLPVSVAMLHAGAVIEQKDLSMQWVQLKRGAGDIAVSNEQAICKKVRQIVTSGDSINLRNLDTPNAVSRNQNVTMILRNGGLEVVTKVTALDSGARGQIVDVVNISNKKRMRAKVVDEQTVEAVAF